MIIHDAFLNISKMYYKGYLNDNYEFILMVYSYNLVWNSMFLMYLYIFLLQPHVTFFNSIYTYIGNILFKIQT